MARSVTLSGRLASPEKRITAEPDLVAGDVLNWGRVRGGHFEDVTIEPDGSFTAGAGVVAFSVWTDRGKPAVQTIRSPSRPLEVDWEFWTNLMDFLLQVLDQLSGIFWRISGGRSAKAVNPGEF
jgi:hypothetical protein